jgi:uncharacterized protein (DUF2141 family)
VERPQPPELASLHPTQISTLVLELQELRNQCGVVNIALFNSPLGFPSNAAQAYRSGSFPVEELPLRVTFLDVPFGQYAVTVHHDENQDGTLNVNSLGIPKEGIGFSSNPKIWMGAPPFHKAKFEFSSKQTMISITMRYLLR